MKTAIKFSKMRSLPHEQQVSCLKQAIDLELRMPAIALDFLENNKGVHRMLMANRAKQFAANDGRFASGGEDISEKQAQTFISANAHLLLDADTQKGLAQAGELDKAGKALWGEKYSTGSDNPILIDLASRFASFFHSNMPDMDTGWMQIYDLVDLRNQAQDHFDIDDTNLGITFTQIAPGAEIKKRTKVSESKTTCGVITFGAALGLLDDWLRFQQFYKIDDAIAEFRSKHYDQMASIHYAPLTALGGGVNVAFTVDDSTTFNAAVAVIIRALANQGYGVGQNTAFTIVCAPEKVGRIMRMLEAQQGSQLIAFGTMKEPIAYTVNAVVATRYVPADDTGYYLILPGRKSKRGLWQDLSVEQMRNIMSRATDWAASAQYNPILGDSNQVRRVLFA